YNHPPVVNAGPAQTIPYGQTLNIVPQISDDGLPNGGVTATWSVLSGPGQATLGGSVTNLAANFGKVGTYVLQLSANDGQYTSTSTVTVTVTSGSDALPVVQITAPAESGSVGLSIPITVTANASDADGSVDSIAFFADGELIDFADTAPYSV